MVVGLAVVQQVRFRQGKIGALALFFPCKEGYLEGAFAVTYVAQIYASVLCTFYTSEATVLSLETKTIFM
jgi:hypothetical protein